MKDDCRVPLLVPRPKQFELTGGIADIDSAAIERIFSAEIELDLILHRAQGPGVLAKQLDSFRFKEIPEISPQGYQLSLSPGEVSISASTRLGFWYGIITLRQLIWYYSSSFKAEKSGDENAMKGTIQIPACTIEDRPDFPVRAILLDISRDRVPRMETIFGLVDLFSALKYNQLQLYMEHTFAYKAHKRVWEKASPFTGEEIGELDTYCTKRGIELVPNQNSFGHMERWLKHPEYQHLAECPSGFTDPWGVYRPVGSCISPAVKESLFFVNSLHRELIQYFSSRTLNIGGDEPWELCQGRSRPLCEKKGSGEVYLEFLLKMHRMVSELGCTMQFYGDIITKYPHLVPGVPDDCIVIEWGYEADHPFDEKCKLFEKSGRTFYVCAGTSSWNSIAGRWQNAQVNILRAAENGLRHGASGYMISDWGDNGHWQQLPVSLPGWLYGAGVSWGIEENRKLDMIEALARYALPVPGIWDGHLSRTIPFCGINSTTLDSARKTAKAILLLSEAYLHEPVRIRNATLLTAILLEASNPYFRKALKAYPGADLKAVEEEIKAANNLLNEVQSLQHLHGDILIKEIDFTTRLLKFASEYGRERLREGVNEIEDIPSSIRKVLSDRLGGLIEDYRELWLKRSRPGGLSDSTGRFEALLDKLL